MGCQIWVLPCWLPVLGFIIMLAANFGFCNACCQFWVLQCLLPVLESLLPLRCLIATMFGVNIGLTRVVGLDGLGSFQLRRIQVRLFLRPLEATANCYYHSHHHDNSAAVTIILLPLCVVYVFPCRGPYDLHLSKEIIILDL